VNSNQGKQATRQAARRAAAEAQASLMRERLERDRRAGDALRALVVDEGVGAAQATQWCAGSVTTREVARLRRLAQAATDADQQ
jgi:hypothetical protein